MVRREWVAGLKGFDVEQIKRGIEVCRNEHAWPPSISEFRDACQVTSDWEHEGEAYKTFNRKSLLSSDARDTKRKELRAKFLADMKARGL